MAVYGVRIQKEDDGVPFENRYFVSATSLDDAQSKASPFVAFEKNIFSTAVGFKKLNLWEIGATPRRHRSLPLSGFGVLSAVNRLPLELVLKLTFGATDSYPYYKEYRVAWSDDYLEGRAWSATVLAAVLDAAELADDDGAWAYNCTKDGAPLGDPVIETKVVISQLHKRWYNQTPPTP